MVAKMRTMLILGCPGSGKGTIAKRIADTFNVTTMSSGDLLRSHISRGTPLGLQVQSVLSRGGLVEDHIISNLVQEDLATITSHVLLDGFPRTVMQAKGLELHLRATGRRLDAVVSLDVPYDVILNRIDGR
jgi:adenylate kinase family enzyme